MPAQSHPQRMFSLQQVSRNLKSAHPATLLLDSVKIYQGRCWIRRSYETFPSMNLQYHYLLAMRMLCQLCGQMIQMLKQINWSGRSMRQCVYASHAVRNTNVQREVTERVWNGLKRKEREVEHLTSYSTPLCHDSYECLQRCHRILRCIRQTSMSVPGFRRQYDVQY